MNKREEQLIKATCWIAIAISIIEIYISREPITSIASIKNLIGIGSEAIGFAVIIVSFYEKLLWKYNPFNTVPVLKNKYEGTFVSTHDQSNIKASLEIHQTFLHISVICTTEESRSESNIAVIDENSELKKLTYCYMNVPDSTVREKSPIHYGTAILIITNPEKIHGNYYTDRETTGTMDFSPVKKSK